MAILSLRGVLLSFTTILATLLTRCPGLLAETKELCQWEKFEASCGQEAVLVIHAARYGRMELGRCVKKDFGYLGCGVDALVELDRACSGRHSCKFGVGALHELDELKLVCTKDLAAYLSVTYSCVKVTACQPGLCQNSDFLKLTESSGVISSVITANSQCGSPDCPWVLQGLPGQKFNISLVDFSHLNVKRSGNSGFQNPCYRYATIKEADESPKDITACKGDAARERAIHISETNSLKIHLYSSAESDVHYLIRYSVLGCPDISAPADATTEREGDTLAVRCVHSNKAWHLTCDGTAWVGEIGNCGPARTAGSTDGGFGLFDATTDSPYGMLIVIALGVALGVAIGVFLLCIVLCYMKSRRRRRPEAGKTNHVLVNGGPPPYGSNAHPGMMGKTHVRMNGESVPISPSGAVIYTPEHNYTTTLHVKRPLPPNPSTNTSNFTDDSGMVGSGHQASDTDTILSDDYNFRPGDMQTFKPRDHVYETPRFPIQDMEIRRNQMHSADGIARNFIEIDDRHGNNRTN